MRLSNEPLGCRLYLCESDFNNDFIEDRYSCTQSINTECTYTLH